MLSKNLLYLLCLSFIPSILANEDGVIRPSKTELLKRDGNLTSTKLFPTFHATGTDGFVYQVDVGFGTLSQEISLRVDIAQPYIWALDGDYYPSCSSVQNSTKCQSNGAYYVEDSPGGLVVSSETGNYTFLDLIQVNGSTVQENLLTFGNLSHKDYYYNDFDDYYNPNIKTELNSFNLSDVRFIDANHSNIKIGALGLAGPDSDDDYSENDNFIELLKSEKFINSSSYSIYPKDDYKLDIILGAVNQSLYFEPLVKFDKLPYLDQLQSNGKDAIRYNYPIAPLTNMYITNKAGSKASVFSNQNQTVPVLLDSRAIFSFLPSDVIVNLAIQLNAYYSSSDSLWFVKCSVGNLGAALGFQFGNVTVNVPISNFIYPLYTDDDSEAVTFDDGEPACGWTVAPNSNLGYSILGTNVLQAMYLVVDNEADDIAIAQANNYYYSQLNNTHLSLSPITTTAAYDSSVILSGNIPFTTANNITDTKVTFSSVSAASDQSTVYQGGATAIYSSGQIFTGDYFPTTTTSNPSKSRTTGGSTSSTEVMEAEGNILMRNGVTSGLGGLCLFFISLLI
ncbi:hypothetical protein WICMUC_005688 [Wickerhamomyces mucosus]|uniref:Peptidase A1 domain-containing protein n=1 Tax=Wickerhamomyces mucosus TaxID=1378264 RepID=A0A9P8P728_9ASCO|nr:hypothetical protein WICMUC_005688 [Wickerhamomyces mucosus]